MKRQAIRGIETGHSPRVKRTKNYILNQDKGDEFGRIARTKKWHKLDSKIEVNMIPSQNKPPQ